MIDAAISFLAPHFSAPDLATNVNTAAVLIALALALGVVMSAQRKS